MKVLNAGYVRLDIWAEIRLWCEMLRYWRVRISRTNGRTEPYSTLLREGRLLEAMFT